MSPEKLLEQQSAYPSIRAEAVVRIEAMLAEIYDCAAGLCGGDDPDVIKGNEQTSLADVVVDLMHFAAARDQRWDDIVEEAEERYREETSDLNQ